MKKYSIFTCLWRKTLVLFGSTLTSRSVGGVVIDRMKTGYLPFSKPMYLLRIWQRKLLTSICRIVLSSGLKNSHIFNRCFSCGQQCLSVCCFKSAPGYFTHVDISQLLINDCKIKTLWSPSIVFKETDRYHSTLAVTQGLGIFSFIQRTNQI